jgi:hypothetical protein
MFARVGDAGRDLGVGGVREVSRLRLLAKKFLVNEAIEDGASVVVGEVTEIAIGKQSFVAEGLIPVRLQDYVAVNGGDDAVDYLGAGAWRGQMKNSEEQHRSRERDLRAGMKFAFQNGWPILKNTLK